MRTIIAGSRTIKDAGLLKQAIEESGFLISEVVYGCAKGADELGKEWALANNIPVTPFPAKWKDLSVPRAVIRNGPYGKFNVKAGFDRNESMAVYAKSGALILLWDGVSDGSRDMLERAKKHNLKIFIKYTNGSSERIN
jgi:hypothetical protein